MEANAERNPLASPELHESLSCIHRHLNKFLATHDLILEGLIMGAPKFPEHLDGFCAVSDTAIGISISLDPK